MFHSTARGATPAQLCIATVYKTQAHTISNRQNNLRGSRIRSTEICAAGVRTLAAEIHTEPFDMRVDALKSSRMTDKRPIMLWLNNVKGIASC